MKYKVIGPLQKAKLGASWKCFPGVFTQDHLKSKHSPWIVSSRCNEFNTVVQIHSWQKCFANTGPLKSTMLSQLAAVEAIRVRTEDFAHCHNHPGFYSIMG